MIVNFGVLTWLDRNIFYCGIVAQFLLIFVASFKFALQRNIVWHPRNKVPIMVYFWASL